MRFVISTLIVLCVKITLTTACVIVQITHLVVDTMNYCKSLKDLAPLMPEGGPKSAITNKLGELALVLSGATEGVQVDPVNIGLDR